MKTENLSTLQLNLLSNEQLKNALNNGKIDPNAFYLTPEENLFIRYAYDAEPTEIFDTWAEGMSYIGFAYAEEAPKSYADYSWSLFIGSDGKDGQPGQSVHIRYSEYEDGSEFTDTWSVGQNYIGFAIGTTAPTVKEDYTWCLFISNIRYTETIVLTVDGWNENKQTVAVPAVAENTTITASPAAETRDEYLDCGVVLVSAEAGNVTFECHHTPTKDVNIELIIIEPNGVYLPPEDNDYSWNDLKDKPFYDNYAEKTFTVTFDGDKADKIIFQNMGSSYVWVSENTIEDISSIVSSSALGMMGGVEDTIDIPNSMWEDISYVLNGVPAIGVVYDYTNAICIAVSLNQAVDTYPAGIYVLANDDTYVTSFTYTIGQEDIKRLDPKFLPEGGVGYEEDVNCGNVLDWDGTPSDIQVHFEGSEYFHKVSDLTVTRENLVGATVRYYTEGRELVITSSSLISMSSFLVCEGDFPILVAYEDNAAVNVDLVLPEKGIYLSDFYDPVHLQLAEGKYFTQHSIHKIDPKFLPEGGFGYEVRRFGDGDTLEYDPAVSNIIHEYNGLFYRWMSAQQPTREELDNHTVTFKNLSTGSVLDESSLTFYDFDDRILLGSWDGVGTENEEFLCFIVIIKDAEKSGFPRNGIYFMENIRAAGLTIALTIPGYGKFGVEIHKIDQKFLPDTLATKADIQAYIDNAILNGAW